MLDEMQIEGKSYISSKRASELSGYAQDYIGQLARKSLIESHRIGGLWYVLPESLDAYKTKADSYKPEPPTRVTTPEPVSLVFFDGKEYLSAASAAHTTGYTQDYVGQLARSGTILSRQVGNRWYVERDSILKHKKEKDSLLGAVQSESVGISKKNEKEAKEPESLIKTSYSGSGPLLNYYSEDADLIPNLPGRPNEMEAHTLHLKNTMLHNEDTWSAQQAVPIKRVYSKQVSGQPLMRHRRSLGTQKMSMGSAFKLFASVAATIVILLSVGYVSVLNKNAVYALNLSKLPSVSALPANTVTAFSRIGDILEPYLTRELVYERADSK